MICECPDFNPAHARREFILCSLLRFNHVHFIPRQLAARRLIFLKFQEDMLIGCSYVDVSLIEKLIEPLEQIFAGDVGIVLPH